MMLVFGRKTAGRLVPIVGAVIGGTANYFFIKRVAGNLEINNTPKTKTAESSAPGRYIRIG